MIIRRTMIQARQLGYKTPKALSAEIKELNEKRKPLTTQQLRDTLDNLETRSLIFRCQPGRRTVYFSTTLKGTELIDAVKLLVGRRKKVQKLRQKDREIFKNL